MLDQLTKLRKPVYLYLPVYFILFFFIYQFIIKDIIKDTDEQPDEEVYRARPRRGGTFMLFSGHHSPSIFTWSPAQKLSEHLFGFLWKLH